MMVENFYNKNQFLIKGGDAIVTLQSYKSIVARILNDGTLEFGSNWNYSKTTSKHLYFFINDFLYDIKEGQRQELKQLNNTQNKRKLLEKLIEKNIVKVNTML